MRTRNTEGFTINSTHTVAAWGLGKQFRSSTIALFANGIGYDTNTAAQSNYCIRKSE